MNKENDQTININLNSLAETETGTTTGGSIIPEIITGHIQDVSMSVKGLIRRLEYKYIVEGLGGNWPVAIVPASGSFVADSKTAFVDVKAIFCPTIALCPSGNNDIMPYNRNYSYGVENKLLFSSLRLKVSEIDSDTDFIYSVPTGISCSNCLPVVGPKITLPNILTLDNDTNNSIIISGIASGISPDTRYSYRFKVLDTTWPVELYPLSGTIKSSTEVLSISSQLVFCESAGSYDTDMCGSTKEKRAILSLELTPLTDNTETVSILSINTSKMISNDMIAECDGCISYPTVSLAVSSANTVVVPNSGVNPGTSRVVSNSGASLVVSGVSSLGGFQQMNMSVPTIGVVTSANSSSPIKTNKADRVNIDVSIQNLKINRTYNYSLENIDSNWPLYVGSRSGEITAVSASTTLNFLGEFCVAPSLCPSGSSAVIPYSAIISHTDAYTSSSFKLKLVDPVVTGTYYSNNIRIYCTDCSQNFMPVVVSSIVSDNSSCK